MCKIVFWVLKLFILNSLNGVSSNGIDSDIPSVFEDRSGLYRGFIEFRDCFGSKNPGMCLKEKALETLNETILSGRPMLFFDDLVEIDRNPQYPMDLNVDLPEDPTARSLKLGDALYDKVEEFFRSRVVKFNMASAYEEGRGKKGGKGGGKGMMMMAMGGMACMMAQMFMGKVAFMAGSAMIMAKLALLISTLIGLKKLGGGNGGGGEAHVVYTDGGHGGGGGGGGGGWHRSLEWDAQNMAYKGHMPTMQQPVNNNVDLTNNNYGYK